MKDFGNTIVVLLGAAVGIYGISSYNSPYNQCVRGQTTINEDREIMIYKYPKSLAQVQCAKALGGKPD